MTGANHSELDEAQFARLVQAYGADPQRWPASVREAAKRHMSSNAATQHLLADARELDRALASVTSPSVPAALEHRLLADFDRAQQRWSLRKLINSGAQIVWPGAPLWQPAAVFAVALRYALPIGEGRTGDAECHVVSPGCVASRDASGGPGLSLSGDSPAGGAAAIVPISSLQPPPS